MTTQTLSSMRNPSERDNEPTQTSLLKMVSLFLLMLVSCFLAAILFSYDVNDPAWVNSGTVSTGEYHNIGGALGAWLSDVLLTGVGYAAYLLPLAGVYLSFRLWRETPVELETLTFRCLALVCGILGFSVLATVHLSNPINSVAITGGGMMGQFFVTKLVHILSLTLLLFAALILFVCCALLFFNVGPLTVIDAIGNLILGKKALSASSNTQSVVKPKQKTGWFAKKSKAEENGDALQAKLRAVSDIDDAHTAHAPNSDDTLVNPAVAARKDSISDFATEQGLAEPTRTTPLRTEIASTEPLGSSTTAPTQPIKKSAPTITPPHYEKTAAQNLTDTRAELELPTNDGDELAKHDAHESGSSLETSKLEASKNAAKNTAKKAIGDLTALLRPAFLQRGKKSEPDLTSKADSALSFDMDKPTSDGASDLTTERTSGKREPSLFGHHSSAQTPTNVDTKTFAEQRHDLSDAEQLAQTNIEQLNADIRAHQKARQHHDNSQQAQAYRQASDYARDENPADAFSQPAAPMQAHDTFEHDEIARPITTTATARKPVNPEIQQKIVSDVLKDSERQAQLRQAPLQPKKHVKPEPFEEEIAKTVSAIPATNPAETKTTTHVNSPRFDLTDSALGETISEVSAEQSHEQQAELEQNSSSRFVEQLNAQMQNDDVTAVTDEKPQVTPSIPTQAMTTPPLVDPIVSEPAVPETTPSEPIKAERQASSTAPVTPQRVEPTATSEQPKHTPTNQPSSSAGVRVNIGQAYETTQKASQVPTVKVVHHELPSIDLLDNAPPLNAAYTEDDLRDMAEVLETTLKEFKLDVTVMNISPGPVITRFEMDLAPGVQASKISRLSNDLARALAVSSVRVEEVIAGSSYIGLEVPNMNRQTVYLKDIFKSKPFQSSKSPLTLALGTDISGQPIVADLKKMPHLLVAGTTGSGKSVSINTMLLSMLYKATPRDLRMIMVDPKMLEMSMYEDIPHLLTPVITDMEDAENALTWAVAEMERRYKLMAAMKIRKIESFNEIVDDAEARGETVKDPLWQPNEAVGYTHHPSLERLPYIVIVIDELADMMMVVGKQVEQLIARLTQKARAAGIHLIIATQRPSTDVLTGLIKANVPTRIAFQVSSGTDSKVIIDTVGAQNLLGNGDMLYVPAGSSHPNRLHGAFVNDQETDRITDFIRSTGEPDYINSITDTQAPEDLGAFGAADVEKSDSDDPLYSDAVEIVLTSGKASISSVQRQLRIGYNRAARMIEQMQADGIVSEPVNGVRKVLRGH